MSVKTKRESVDFKSSPSPRKESKITPLAQMYDQLAAMGQQKAEEKKLVLKKTKIYVMAAKKLQKILYRLKIQRLISALNATAITTAWNVAET